VAEAVVDALEVVEVQRDRSERGLRAGGLGEHAPQRVLHRPPVGQAGQRVGGGALLGDRQVAQVGDDRGGLRDRVVDVRAPARPRGSVVGDEHRADDLARDEQRRARGQLALGLAAQVALQEVVAVAGELAAEAYGHAGPRTRAHERLGQVVTVGQHGLGLEAVRAVVALQDHDLAALDVALEVAAHELVCLLLGVHELQRAREVALAVAPGGVLAVAAVAAGGRATDGQPATGGEEEAQPHDEGHRQVAGA
jgi:hypothetical protein